MTPATSDTQPAIRPQAITSRYLDFWLLGGASLVLWTLLMALTPWRDSSATVNTYLDNAAGFFVTCFLLVNYPHFMASYKLAYGMGLRFICRHWFQLLLVPLLLIGLIVHAFLYADSPAFYTQLLNEALSLVGIDTSFQALSDSHSAETMSVLLLLMYFSVGHHYSKQAYGCMMVYSYYDGYRLNLWQRRAVKWGLFSVWFANYFAYHRGYAPGDFYGVSQYPLDFTAYGTYLGYGSFAVTLAALFYLVIVKNYRTHKQLPTANFLIPYVSLVIWWLPPFNQPFFYMTAVPFFHSLQYLPFVYRFEARQIPAHYGTVRRNIRSAAIVVALIITGWLSFNLVPERLDLTFNTIGLLNIWYFTAASHIFINIHHYFIDNVIWRFNNPNIKKYLLT